MLILAQTKNEPIQRFLVYSNNIKEADETFFNIISEVKLEDYPTLPIYNYEQLMYRMSHQKERIPDVKLSEVGIRSYDDLCREVRLVESSKSSLSLSLRQLVKEKFDDLNKL